MIYVNGKKIKFNRFPNGETLVDGNELLFAAQGDIVNEIGFKYQEDSDLIKLMFVKKHLDEHNLLSKLVIYYMPYSRMDRVEGNSVFTLKHVAEFINDLAFADVVVIEPHSDVTPALLDYAQPVYTNFDLLPEVLKEIGFDKEKDYLFFPDAGAQKRYSKLKGYRYLVGYKHRDFESGEIKSLDIVGEIPSEPFKVLICDDLSSYGGTFLASGNALREAGATEVYLLVAHCENSVFEGKLLLEGSPINKIFTTNSILTRGTNKIKQYEIQNLMSNKKETVLI